MDKSKLKNIIILVLLAVNLCFLLLVLLDRRESVAAERSAARSVAQIYAANGTKLAPELVLSVGSAADCTLRRDLNGEAAALRKLLGELTVTDQGGNIYYYSGEYGEAIFRGTGEFEILMNEASDLSGDPLDVCAGVMKKLGIDFVRPDRSTVEASMPSVTLSCMIQGAEAFNCRVTLSFAGERLMLVSGTRPFDSVTVQETGSGAMDAPTLLMRFLELSVERGYVYSEITSLELGYNMELTVSGECSLSTVWRIGTDSGDFYVSGLTGEPI